MVAAVSRGPCHSMESILVKILAVVLALSQVSTRPDDVRTQFDSAADRAQVVELLRAGCAHMRKVFEVEDLALDDLVETALAVISRSGSTTCGWHADSADSTNRFTEMTTSALR